MNPETIKFEFNATKMLKGILETDSTVHENIRKKVEAQIIDDIVDDIQRKYFKENWGEKQVADRILDDLKEKVEGLAKEILKDFYNSYRYKKKDITILKKLKELLGEED